ncbi:MAG: ribonuclease P protein component [Sphingomonadales bacterium]
MAPANPELFLWASWWNDLFIEKLLALTKRFTLSAAQRLKSKKSIDALFNQGQRLSVGSIRIFHGPAAAQGIRMGVGVSAKHFPSSVDRNRIKRQLRDCYRLQQEIVSGAVALSGGGIDIFVVYTEKELPDYHHLFTLMQKGLTKLVAHYQRG